MALRFVRPWVVQKCPVVWLVVGVPLAEPSWGRAATQVEGRMRFTVMSYPRGGWKVRFLPSAPIHEDVRFG